MHKTQQDQIQFNNPLSQRLLRLAIMIEFSSEKIQHKKNIDPSVLIQLHNKIDASIDSIWESLKTEIEPILEIKNNTSTNKKG